MFMFSIRVKFNVRSYLLFDKFRDGYTTISDGIPGITNLLNINGIYQFIYPRGNITFSLQFSWFNVNEVGPC